MLISFIFSYSEKFFVVFYSSFFFVLGQGPSARVNLTLGGPGGVGYCVGGSRLLGRVVAPVRCPLVVSGGVWLGCIVSTVGGGLFARVWGGPVLAHANCTLFCAPNAQKRTGSQQGKKTIFLDVS